MSIVVSIFSVIAVRMTGLGAYYLVSESNAPFALLTAVCSFMFFKSIDIPRSKFINTGAASTFGVLLIHANGDIMRQWLWGDLLRNTELLGSLNLYNHALLSVLLVFSICTLIDWVRRITIEESMINAAEKFVRKTISKTR